MKDGHTVCSRATAAVYMDAAGKKYYFSKKLQNLKFLWLYQKNNQFKTNTFRKGESKICSSYLDIRTENYIPKYSYNSVDGSAKDGRDYIVKGRRLDFAPGEQSASISVAFLTKNTWPKSFQIAFNGARPINLAFSYVLP